jgi:Flp pilus assembly pilin Flp
LRHASTDRIASVPVLHASTEVDFSPAPDRPSDFSARRHALELPKGGEPHMTYSQWISYFRARFASEEGQTMAEYGVVLAVICLLTVGIFTALSGGIQNAVQAVIDVLPG